MTPGVDSNSLSGQHSQTIGAGHYACQLPSGRQHTWNPVTSTEDCTFYDPNGGLYRGRDEIDRIAGVIKSTHPDFRYQPIAEPEELGNGGRVRWVSGRPW